MKEHLNYLTQRIEDNGFSHQAACIKGYDDDMRQIRYSVLQESRSIGLGLGLTFDQIEAAENSGRTAAIQSFENAKIAQS